MIDHPTSREQAKEIQPMIKDEKVVHALCQFIGCSQKELHTAIALRTKNSSTANVTLRNTSKSKKVSNGYFSFTIPKGIHSNEFRTISAPADTIKSLQSRLLNTLRNVPISSAVQGGEPGTSPLKNALHHAQSSYLYTTDIASAYPSVSSQRIHANLMGALSKMFMFSFPHLTQGQREQCVHILTTLLTHHDTLPQGAPTSPRLLNIVLAKIDQQILSLLHGDEGNLIKPVYTRYIDDIAISGRHPASFEKFARKGKDLLEKITNDSKTIRDGLTSPEKVVSSLVTSVDTFLMTPVHVADESSRKRMRKYIFAIKNVLNTTLDKEILVDKENERDELKELLGRVDAHLQSINTAVDHEEVSQLQTAVRKIIAKNGFDVKMKKEKVWTPSSSAQKEITGVLIGKDGKLGISRRKVEAYRDLAKTAVLSPNLLDKRFLNKDGAVDGLLLAYCLTGMRNFIIDIKGRSPDYFEKRFLGAKAKHFSKVHVPTTVRTVRGISGGV